MTIKPAPSSRHVEGAILVVISAAVFSTAGIFTKGVGVGSWNIIFWRGVFASAFTISYTLWRGSFRREFIEMGKSGWAAAAVGALGTAVFIPAFKYTTVANVSLIYAATPLVAAVLSWLWMGERPTKTVLAGCIATLLGVAVIVSGSLGSIHLVGDLLACFMDVLMAIMFVIYRRFPETPAAGPAVWSSLLLLPLGLVLGAPFTDGPGSIGILAVFGIAFAVGSVTLGEGARRLPATETALLSLLEVALAPVLAWIIFAEHLKATTWTGGGMILAGIIGSQIASSRDKEASRSAE
jgi:drug/metabolite transporter (DMT)-like permease